jgi:hypothetical protein
MKPPSGVRGNGLSNRRGRERAYGKDVAMQALTSYIKILAMSYRWLKAREK